MSRFINHTEFREGQRILIESASSYYHVWLQEITYLKIRKDHMEINLQDKSALKIDINSPTFNFLIKRKEFYPITNTKIVNVSAIMACLKTGVLIMKGGKKIHFPKSDYALFIQVWAQTCGFGIYKNRPLDLFTRRRICEMIMQTRSLMC